MIHRYPVECPHCRANIVLRISVGLDEEQPFYFICSTCGSATRGKQIIWYKPFPGARIELEEGRILENEPEEPNQIINIHPDLPAFKNAKSMMETGGSPFLFTMAILGQRNEEFMKRLKTFRELVDRDWNNVRRWLSHYTERRWEGFDRTGELIFEENWVPPTSNMQRHDLIHRALDIMISPILLTDHYIKMKQSWYETWATGNGIPPETVALVAEFARNEVSTGGLTGLQRDIFHCLELYINNRSNILPALSISMYPSGIDHAIQDLQLFRDDFPILRDLYITTFETCHKAIKYILAPVNAAQRGNVQDFGDGVIGFSKFVKKVNAQKAEFLKNIPDWQTQWDFMFDRQLRNKIGHHAIRHDLSSGELVIEGEQRIAYIDFVVATFNLISGILIVANALKTLAIADSISRRE